MADSIQRLDAALEGRYRIEGEVGEGGMARVYLARDLRHDRDVALKVLKPELAAVVGAERFLAEIKTTANLQHPNILPLFDSGEAAGSIFFVMPYVEGETLRERLDREKQLPVDEAVGIALEVADALEHAHARGIVHRDIKPGNILLRDGRPLVADFGIALAAKRSGGGERLTETGLSLGTPYYMSPEQATGSETVGPTADVYALGCVLYEMLAGDPPYVGSTPQSVLAKIITGGGRSVSEERPTVPPNVDGAVARAIEKLPADRFPSASDFARALQDETFRYGVGAAPPAETVRRLRRWAVGATAVAVVLAVALVWSALRPQEPRPVSRFEITLPDSLQLYPGVALSSDLTSDGSSVGFVGSVGDGVSAVWQRPRDQLVPVPVAGTRGALHVRFSPDDSRIAFTTDSTIRTVPRAGGTPRTVLSDGGLTVGGLAWSSDGMIYYRRTDESIWRIADIGGEPERVTTSGPRGGHFVPEPLPGGRGLLYTISSPQGEEVVAVDLETGESRVLVAGALARYMPPGHIVYQSPDGTALMAAPFDAERLELAGPPRTVLAGVWDAIPGHLAVSDRGDLLYRPHEGVVELAARELVWVDRSGVEEPVDPDMTARDFREVALSPDGERLAVTIGLGEEVLWVKELPRGPLTRLTTGLVALRPVWSSDGRTIAFISAAEDDSTTHARTVRSDGSSAGVTRMLLRRQRPVWEVQYGPEPGQLVFREGGAGTGEAEADIGLVTFGADTTATELLATPFNERSVALSPDGRWLAYVSDLSGRDEVYVRPFPDVTSRRTQVSTNGGAEPRWAHGTNEIFYREVATGFRGPGRSGSGAMMAATYAADSVFRVESRERLFDASGYVFGDPGGGSHWPMYDVSRDDQRFLMTRIRSPTAQTGQARLIFVENFVSELEGTTRRR